MLSQRVISIGMFSITSIMLEKNISSSQASLPQYDKDRMDYVNSFSSQLENISDKDIRFLSSASFQDLIDIERLQSELNKLTTEYNDIFHDPNVDDEWQDNQVKKIKNIVVELQKYLCNYK